MLKKTVNFAENKRISNENELGEIFQSGCKSCEKKFVGVEFEKLAIDKQTYQAVPYFKIAEFLEQYAKNGWTKILDNNFLLGLSSKEGTVTLEPGSQTEISLTPRENLSQVALLLESYNKKTAQIGENLGIKWLGCGVQPLSTYENINIIPKKRYEYMTKYLPTVSKRPFVMMRETAGIQASFDYSNEEDAMRKFSCALKLSPIISSVFANSPIRNGKLTKYKSNRMQGWLDMDKSRTGLVCEKAFNYSEFSFDDYVQILLDVPMIFIERENSDFQINAISVGGITFRDFLKKGFNGYFATEQDWLLHLSLYFPDVRFKNYIEVRNHDNQKKENIMAVPAFWKGILYNNDAISAIDKLLKDFKYNDYLCLREETPKMALDTTILNYRLCDVAKEIFQIAYDSLKSFGQQEHLYLDNIINLIQKGLTPADVLINKWENEWNGDLGKFVEYSQIN